MTGTVLTMCPSCGCVDRVEVEFPVWNRGFVDTKTECKHCGVELVVTDPHEYNTDGTITDGLYEVVVQHYGESHSKKTADLEKALAWAEEAVYDIGAEYSAVYNPDGSLYVEYEM